MLHFLLEFLHIQHTDGRTEKTLYPFVLKIGKLHKLKEIELKYCDSRILSDCDSYEIGNL